MKAKMSRFPFELLRVHPPFQFGMLSFRVIIEKRFSRERTRLQRPRDQVAYRLANTSRVFRWAFGDRAFYLLMESACIQAKMMAQRTHGGKRVRLNSPVKFPVDRVEMGGRVGITIEIGGVIKLSAVDEPKGATKKANDVSKMSVLSSFCEILSTFDSSLSDLQSCCSSFS